MSRGPFLQAAWGAGALVMIVARLAAAENAPSGRSGTDKVRLAYRAPPDCPSESAFASSVRERLPGGWEAAPGELAIVFDVDVSTRGERFSATIRFSNAEGEPFQREVEGASCIDVVNGMALVAALAIRSRVGDVEEPPPPPPPPAPRPSEPAPPASTPSAPPPEPTKARSVFFRAGALGMLTTGVGPGLAFGGGAFFGAELSGARLELVLAAVASGRVSAESIPSEFRLLVARLDGCPLALGLGNHLAVEPCALFELGSLRAETFESQPRVTKPDSGSATWLAPGALVRAVARFQPLVLELEGFARFPLFHEQFYVDAGGARDTVFEVPTVAWGAALGLGLRF